MRASAKTLYSHFSLNFQDFREVELKDAFCLLSRVRNVLEECGNQTSQTLRLQTEFVLLCHYDPHIIINQDNLIYIIQKSQKLFHNVIT